MADYLQKFPLVDGVAIDIEVSDTIIIFDIVNDSPFDVDIFWAANKATPAFTLHPTTGIRGASPVDLLRVSKNQWDGVITAIPSFPMGGTNPTDAPAAQLTVTGWRAAPAGQIFTLNRSANIGNPVVTSNNVQQLLNSGEATPLDVIKDQPLGFSGPTLHDINTGEFHRAGLSNGALADMLATIPGDATHPAVVQIDNNQLATDGSGNISKMGAASLVPKVQPVGVTLYVQSATPASPNKYDVWFVTSF